MNNITENMESTAGMTRRVYNMKKLLRSDIPQVCLSRARLITESFRQTEAEPVAIRQAKALQNVLSKIKIEIGPDELIVGEMSEIRGRRSSVIKPEDMTWLEKEMDNLAEREIDKTFISEEDKNLVPELISYWKGKTIKEKAFFQMPDELRAEFLGSMGIEKKERSIYEANMGSGEELVQGLEDNEKIITDGLEKVAGEVEGHLNRLDITEPSSLSKIHFYRAVLISLKAVIDFAGRYAILARKLAEKEQDKIRREELKMIAGICKHVPAKPARTFHEALQSIWLLHIALHIEGAAGAWGRLDQYLIPFYRRDLETGRLDRKKAKELLQCFYIKLNSWDNLTPFFMCKYFHPSASVGQNITLGGVDKDGRDATNELSYLMLEADGDLFLMEPETVVRFHKDMPMDFAIKVCEVAKKCRGKIKFIGDNAAMGKMMNQGHSLERARDFAVQGCFEPYVTKMTSFSPMGGGASINLLLLLELALNDGASMLTGKQLGPHTGDPLGFKSVNDILLAFRAQLKHVIDLGVRSGTVTLESAAQSMSIPLRSSLVQGCLEKGVDIAGGGVLHNVCWASGHGATNVADSLAAIKKYVLDEGRLTMGQLMRALASNFEDREDIRQLLLSAPKFGNDDDYVDLIAREVVSIYAEESQRKVSYRGNRQIMAQLEGLQNVISLGWSVGASADGRKRGEPLADGGISPVQGRNTKGVTATFKSVAKVDHKGLHGGEGLNMRISPDSLKDDRAIRKFATLVKTYLTDLGGFHCQFNIISGDTLRDAQRNPEKYQDLLVRVATYTAYFIELSTEVQENIISWTELGLG